jgi:hypothetical protein
MRIVLNVVPVGTGIIGRTGTETGAGTGAGTGTGTGAIGGAGVISIALIIEFSTTFTRVILSDVLFAPIGIVVGGDVTI